MSDPRIADVPSGGPALPSAKPAPPSHLLTWVGARVSSPRGVMVVIPLLVGVLGVFLTAMGQHALHVSNVEAAHQHLDEQAQLVAAQIRIALGRADPLLDRLTVLAQHHGPERPFDSLAHSLADLVRNRSGITYVSISFPDGTFQGAYVDTDGAVRFQDSRVGASTTTVRRFDLAAGGTLTLQRQEQTSYDPRQRPFYRLAVAHGQRAWTDPYPFFGSRQTGVTKVAPVFFEREGARVLHAVVTVDFDVIGLSSQLDRQQLHDTRSLLFAKDGVVLAYAADEATLAKLPTPTDQTLRYADLHDPTIDALFSAVADADDDNRDQHVRAVEAAGKRHLVAIANASPDPALPWSIAYFANEDVFLQGLHVYQRNSAWIALAALIASIAIAFLFARSITRARKEVASAKADAEQARKEAKELGSYRLVACLGKGAMGEVWRAEHRLLARQAAIKLINPDLRGKNTAEIRGRFRREAQTLAALCSRNTIELFDYGIAADGTFFFVMELLDGMDLDTLVERHGPLPVERVIRLLTQACSSLAEAHDRGLVHRDIKPANIFVCRAADEVDVVKVLDFGLVLADEQVSAMPIDGASAGHDGAIESGNAKLTNAGGLMGTPAFMPPEQAMGQALDGRADLYALACVAVWLLTGRLVFPYTDPMQLLIAHMNEPVPDLRAQLPNTVPDALVALLTRCLQKQPQDRPANMRELSRALRAIVLPTAWTEDRAQAWWLEHHRPNDPASEPGQAAMVASAPTLLSVHE